jgi:hypothetical protein
MHVFYQIKEVSEYIIKNELDIALLDKFIFDKFPKELVYPGSKIDFVYEKNGENIIANEFFNGDLNCNEDKSFIDISEYDLDFFKENLNNMYLDYANSKFIYRDTTSLFALNTKISSTSGGLESVVADLSKTVEILLLYITENLDSTEKDKIKNAVTHNKDNLLVGLQYDKNSDIYIDKFLKRQEGIRVLVQNYLKKRSRV